MQWPQQYSTVKCNCETGYTARTDGSLIVLTMTATYSSVCLARCIQQHCDEIQANTKSSITPLIDSVRVRII